MLSSVEKVEICSVELPIPVVGASMQQRHCTVSELQGQGGFVNCSWGPSASYQALIDYRSKVHSGWHVGCRVGVRTSVAQLLKHAVCVLEVVAELLTHNTKYREMYPHADY